MNYGLFIFLVAIVWGSAKALNCRTDGGPKDEELRSVFMNCLKKHAQSNHSHISSNQNPNSNMRSDRGHSTESTRNSEYGMDKDQMPHSNDKSQDGSHVQSSTMSSNRRHRRERPNKMKESTTGQRSQYNPNTQPRDSQDGMGSEVHDYTNSQNHRNMSANNMMNMTDQSIQDDTACVIHCFLQDLEMTTDTGLPDRHLVTNVFTRDVKQDELKEFLQESIEECFQMIQNDNVQDMCEFSKTLMMCLSEKGRTNCEDWKEGSIHF